MRFLSYDIWHSELVRPSWYRRAFYRIVRILTLASQRFVTQRSSFHAAALTYFTMLSIVPLLALATATARGLGYYDTFKSQVFEPFLEEYVPAAPPTAVSGAGAKEVADALGKIIEEGAELVTDAARPGPDEETPSEGAGVPGAGVDAGPGLGADAEPQDAAAGNVEADTPAEVELSPLSGGPGENALRGWIDSMVDEVDQVNSSSLGLIGLGVLIFTVIKLMATIEGSFNEIWGIRQSRTVVRKLADYLTMLLITPILLLVGTGIAAWVNGASQVSLLGFTLDLSAVTGFLFRFAPLVAIWFAFALTYLTLPNTRTNFSSALWGGVFGGSLWHVTQLAYFKLQVGLAGYNAVVAGFAFVPMLLYWVYLSWVMMLMGAQVAFAHQYERSYRGIARIRSSDLALRENLALRVMIRVGLAFRSGDESWHAATLAQHLGVPQRPVDDVFERLVEAGLLAPVGESGEPRYLPGRDLTRITAKDIVDALRVGPGGDALPARNELDRYVEDLVHELDRSQSESGANRTLLQMVEHAERAQAPPAEPALTTARAKPAP